MLDIVLFIFGIMAVGFLAKHFGLLPEGAYKPINDYVYYISMPALVFAKLAETHLGPEHLVLLLANLLPIAAMMLLVVALWKWKIVTPKMAAALLLTSFFGNIVYMGFPIVKLKFGASALSSAAIISAIYNFMIFGIGMLILSAIAGKKGNEGKKLVGNTIIISCLLGALFSLASIGLPPLLLKIIDTLGATTAPMALFSVGLFLHGKKIAKAPSSIALLCAFKLLLFPALFVASALILGLKGQPLQISFLEALMPVAVTNFVIAQKFGLDDELVAESVLASTIIAIPLLLGFDFLLALLAF